MEYALIIGLAVVIVGTVVLSVIAFLGDDTPTGETTGKQRFHCLKCEHEFDALEAYPNLMSEGGFGPMTQLDCPKCKAVGTCVRMLECPECGTFFVSEQARLRILPGSGQEVPEICPKCKTDYHRWFRKKR